jgi:cobalt ABC transporter, ATPase subunit
MKEINIENLKDRPCHHLSYGQKKRVSIAAITVMEPDLLILDEPTAWLDSKNTRRVSEILKGFSEAGKTLIVSTHDTDFAYEFADYIYVLDKGRIVRQGNRDEVFEDFEFLRKLNLNIPNVLKIKSYLKYKKLDENDYYKFLEEKNLL